MKPLCVTAVVDQGYQEYIPLFLHFLFGAYPDYEAILYFDGTMYAEVEECLRLLRGRGAFEIKPLTYAYDRSSQHSLMSLRWVIYDDDFARYENVYVGDVDLFLARESPSLCELRSRHSEEIGLPYSNRVRRGSPRLTGLHFMRTHEYYPRARAVMEKYRDLIAAGGVRLHTEEVLYRMMEESLGLPRIAGNFTVHHGIHLRVFQKEGQTLADQRARTDYLFRKVFERYSGAFFEVAKSDACAEILARLSRISYPGGIPARYAGAGPAMRRQFDNVVALCRELAEEERA